MSKLIIERTIKSIIFENSEKRRKNDDKRKRRNRLVARNNDEERPKRCASSRREVKLLGRKLLARLLLPLTLLLWPRFKDSNGRRKR